MNYKNHSIIILLTCLTIVSCNKHMDKFEAEKYTSTYIYCIDHGLHGIAYNMLNPELKSKVDRINFIDSMNKNYSKNIKRKRIGYFYESKKNEELLSKKQELIQLFESVYIVTSDKNKFKERIRLIKTENDPTVYNHDIEPVEPNYDAQEYNQDLTLKEKEDISKFINVYIKKHKNQ